MTLYSRSLLYAIDFLQPMLRSSRCPLRLPLRFPSIFARIATLTTFSHAAILYLIQ